MDLAEKKAWVALGLIPGVGPWRFKLLLDYFGSGLQAYQASVGSWRALGLPEKTLADLTALRQTFDIDSYFLRCEKSAVRIITYEEKVYPKLLKEVVDKPPVLYVRCRNEVWEKVFISPRIVAVVGTRRMTAYGQAVTRQIVRDLTGRGWTIVSGLARGVDGVAHREAVAGGGKTIAVLGCGLDRVYPPEHRLLAETIVASGGAIVSELPLGSLINRGNFPARNRIIAGLSLGVVVTEASQDSGSLITVAQAAEQGREVFAVPGPITSPLSGGTAELLKKGAKLVTSAADIIEELRFTA